MDRFKFHRVVKLLRELEQKELDKVVVKEIKAEEQPEELEEIYKPQNIFLENRMLSIGASFVCGLILFLIDLVLRGNEVQINSN